MAFIAVATGACLNAINSTLIVTAYPELARAFDMPYARVSVLVMYYLAATAAAQPLAGALGDFLGRRRVFLLAILGFCAASIAAGLVDDFDHLVFWRVIQALFSGTITANAATLVHRIVPEAKIGAYLGLLGSAMLGSSALAFPLGGLVVHYLAWPGLFWCSVPLGLVALLLVFFYVPRDDGSRVRVSSLSALGLPFVPFAVTLQAFVLDQSLLWPTLAWLVTTAVVVAGVLRSPASRGQFARINNFAFNMGTLVALFAAAITFSLMFMLPAWVTISLGLTPTELGVYLASYTFAMMLSSPMSGNYIDGRGDRVPRILTGLLVVLGYAALLGLSNRPGFVLAMLCIGAASAAAQVISQRASLLAAPREVQALAMGIFNTYRMVGCMLGNALPAYMLAQHPQMSAALGADIVAWSFAAFGLPLLLAMWFAGRGKRFSPR